MATNAALDWRRRAAVTIRPAMHGSKPLALQVPGRPNHGDDSARSGPVRSRTFGRSLGVGLMLLGFLATGCAPKVEKQISEAEASYDAGKYEEAYTQAVKAQDAARTAGGGTSADGKNAELASAAYLAGLSAYRLDRLDDARRELDVAIDAGEGEAAGRAYAQRGAVNLRQGRYSAAAADYEEAAELLDGEDATKARDQANAARRAGGSGSGGGQMTPTGSTGLRVSASTTPGGSPAAGTAPTTTPLPPLRTSWTLQAACFRDRAAAEKQAKALASMAKAQGIAAPRVEEQQNPNLGQVYCVLIGEFATREGAEQAKAKLGRREYFVRTARGT